MSHDQRFTIEIFCCYFSLSKVLTTFNFKELEELIGLFMTNGSLVGVGFQRIQKA